MSPPAAATSEGSRGAAAPSGLAPSLERGGCQWRVRLPVFDGPLELLLTLIRRADLDVTTVALAQVTDQYLAHVAALEAVDVPELAEFCDTASTLVAIKSRLLLPRPPGAGEEEEAADAHELVERLRAYRRFRQVAEQLGEREREGLRAFPRAAPPPEAPSAPPPSRPEEEATADDLAEAFRAALAAAARQAEAEKAQGPPVRAHRVRLRARFTSIRNMLVERGKATFDEVVLEGRPPEAEPREFVIVSFLALLEMLRRWAVRVRQEGLFGQIVIEARPELVDVPLPGEHGSFLESDDALETQAE